MNDEEFDRLWTSCDWRQEIDQLRAENESLIEELNEQARLLGISAEKELALLTKVEQLERELAKVKKDANRYRWLCNKVAVLNDGYATLCVPCSGVNLTEEDKRDTGIAIDKAVKGKWHGQERTV